MTAQQKVLPAPVLKEAIEGVLYVHNLIDPAHAVIAPFPNARPGDEVELTVETSTGNQRRDRLILTPEMVGKPIVFTIPKKIFAEGLVPGATAKLHYRTSDDAGNVAVSPALQVRLEL